MNTLLSRCLSSKRGKSLRCCEMAACGLFSTKASIGTTYLDLYKHWVHKFEDAMVPEPLESAGYIVSHLLGKKTFSLVSHGDLMQRTSDSDAALLNDLCRKRLERVPVQYIIGEWDFFGVNLKMRPPVFIPRPETEELARLVLQDIYKRLEESGNPDTLCKVLEIGCGTGAIALSVLDKVQNQSVEVVAIDAAEHAAKLSKENAEILGLAKDSNKLRILHHALLGDKDRLLSDLGPFDIIVSNPPYISTVDMKELPDEIARYEDETALFGGETGLDVIEDILGLAQSTLKRKGSVWLEVDSSQPSLMKSLYKTWRIRNLKDLFGKERFCHLALKLDAT